MSGFIQFTITENNFKIKQSDVLLLFCQTTIYFYYLWKVIKVYFHYNIRSFITLPAERFVMYITEFVLAFTYFSTIICGIKNKTIIYKIIKQLDDICKTLNFNNDILKIKTRFTIAVNLIILACHISSLYCRWWHFDNMSKLKIIIFLSTFSMEVFLINILYMLYCLLFQIKNLFNCKVDEDEFLKVISLFNKVNDTKDDVNCLLNYIVFKLFYTFSVLTCTILYHETTYSVNDFILNQSWVIWMFGIVTWNLLNFNIVSIIYICKKNTNEVRMHYLFLSKGDVHFFQLFINQINRFRSYWLILNSHENYIMQKSNYVAINQHFILQRTNNILNNNKSTKY